MARSNRTVWKHAEAADEEMLFLVQPAFIGSAGMRTADREIGKCVTVPRAGSLYRVEREIPTIFAI